MASRSLSINASPSKSTSLWQDAVRRLVRNWLSRIGLLIIVVLAIVAMLAPIITPYDPLVQNLELARESPSADYWFGTDQFGRDILSRVIIGARLTVLVSLLAVGMGLGIGGTLGLIAGFTSGWLDEVIMRVMDVILSFPYLLLAIAVVAALGPGAGNAALAIGVWTIPAFARLVRGQTISVRDREYVTAARAIGASTGRILWRHLVPNITAPVIVFLTLYMASAILAEAALSFLGLGVQPPDASWGLMVANGRDFLIQAPHIATFPGLAIMMTVLGFNLLGDGLRDALDPRLRS